MASDLTEQRRCWTWVPKKPRRRKPEEIAAESVGRASFERGEILLHPDDGPVRQHSERKRKTRRSAVVKVPLRAKLMHLAKH